MIHWGPFREGYYHERCYVRVEYYFHGRYSKLEECWRWRQYGGKWSRRGVLLLLLLLLLLSSLLPLSLWWAPYLIGCFFFFFSSSVVSSVVYLSVVFVDVGVDSDVVDSVRLLRWLFGLCGFGRLLLLPMLPLLFDASVARTRTRRTRARLVSSRRLSARSMMRDECGDE